MARFGLVDSDDESRSDAPLSHASDHSSAGSDSETHSSHLHSHSDDDDDDDMMDAPPRASLLSSDEHGDEDDESDGERSLHSTSTRSRTRSPPAKRRLPPPQARTSQQQQAWAQQLHLEPKRVQLMQASFFGQPSTPTAPPPLVSTPGVTEQPGKKPRLAPAPAPAPAPSAAAAPSAVPTPVLDPQPFRPYRTYTRVPLADSLTRDRASRPHRDAGLSLARSYRVGWGTRNQLVTLAQDDQLQIATLNLVAHDTDTGSEAAKVVAVRLLELQLEHSDIFPSSLTDPESSSHAVPFAAPVQSLRFHHFAHLFSSESTSALESSPESRWFQLASHLFDEVRDLSIPEAATAADPQYRTRITRLRRQELLSTWFSQSILPLIARESTSTFAKILNLLTAHEIEQACQLALESNNLRLATLLSQLGGPCARDAEFQQDLHRQLDKWHEYQVDLELDDHLRKIYQLMSGRLDEGVLQLEGLDWKQCFALGLWYSASTPDQDNRSTEDQDQVARAVKSYDRAFRSNDKVTPPTLAASSSSPETPTTPRAYDPVYHLLKLYTDPSYSLEESILPKNFQHLNETKRCLTDYRMTWHLYLMFSRVLSLRDFEDRQSSIPGEDDDDDEMDREDERGQGNSVRADQVTVSYASQLESVGLWQWSVFVLLHLELDLPRSQAIQQVLDRNVERFTPETTEFLTSKLAIPPLYLDLARLNHSQSIGDVFTSYKLLIKCHRTNRAHLVCVEQLVPEAIIRGDHELVKRLLEPFRTDDDDEDESQDERSESEASRGIFRGTVQGWEEGGQIYLRYLYTLDLFSSNRTTTLSKPTYLAKTIEKVQTLIEQQHRQSRSKVNQNDKVQMALCEMSSRLNLIAKTIGGRALMASTKPKLLSESDKLVWIQGATDSLLRTSLDRFKTAAVV
ncbi:uncharacterized protein JCM15063_000290 [Sporobolomyces koalae]|uniref:uncharacterized protein n=1 Tax=Sporobolomyces koalae TaxID=500713 RepID=UPI0031742812